LNSKEVISHIIEKIPEIILNQEVEIVIYTNAAFKNDFQEYLNSNDF
jgi:hypothetical protein